MPRKKARRTLSSNLGVSQGRLSRKIAKVTRDSPGLTRRQAAGKAKGILEGARKKRKR